jgi:hypothetical protein
MDLATIAPVRRNQLIEAGRRVGSDVTLAQANKTLKGLEQHGPKLVAFGFGPEDGLDLGQARDALLAGGVGRHGKRTDKKQMSAAYAQVMRDGLQVRLRSRSILGGARRSLARIGSPEAVAAVQRIDAVLNTCSVAPDYASPLATQLDELRRGLVDLTIAPVVAGRGGPQAVADLTARAAALRAADQTTAGARGTPEHTEHLDLVDGVILELVRGAREAAEVASKELGEPALLAAFALSELYPNSGGRGAPDTGAEEPAPGTGTETPANDAS